MRVSVAVAGEIFVIAPTAGVNSFSILPGSRSYVITVLKTDSTSGREPPHAGGISPLPQQLR